MLKPLSIHISTDQILQQVKLKIPFLVGINLWMILGTVAFKLYFREVLDNNWGAGSAIKYLLVQFNLATENVLASWYSSMLLFTVGLMATMCFILDIKKSVQARHKFLLNSGWLFIGLIFFLLSADEMGSLHERIGMMPIFNMSGDTGLGWVRVLAIPIGIVGISMFYFAWVRLRRCKKSFLFFSLGLSSYILNPILEALEMSLLQDTGNPFALHFHDFFILIEEGLEMFGTLFFLLSAMIYADWINNQNNQHALIKRDYPTNNQYFTLKLKGFSIFHIILLSLISFIMTLANTLDLASLPGDAGLIQNWCPSIMAFFCALTCGYILATIPNNRMSKVWIFYYLSMISFGILSALYGTDFKRWLPFISFGEYISSGLFLLTCIALVLSIFLAHDPRILLFSVLGFLLVGISFNQAGVYIPTLWDVFALDSLLIVFMLHLSSWQGLYSSEYTEPKAADIS